MLYRSPCIRPSQLTFFDIWAVYGLICSDLTPEHVTLNSRDSPITSASTDQLIWILVDVIVGSLSITGINFVSESNHCWDWSYVYMIKFSWPATPQNYFMWSKEPVYQNFGPRHEKTFLCHMRTTKPQISLCIRAVWSTSCVVRCWDSIMAILAKSKISAAEQGGLTLTWSETP